jgi:hypothetical protein
VLAHAPYPLSFSLSHFFSLALCLPLCWYAVYFHLSSFFLYLCLVLFSYTHSHSFALAMYNTMYLSLSLNILRRWSKSCDELSRTETANSARPHPSSWESRWVHGEISASTLRSPLPISVAFCTKFLHRFP